MSNEVTITLAHREATENSDRVKWRHTQDWLKSGLTLKEKDPLLRAFAQSLLTDRRAPDGSFLVINDPKVKDLEFYFLDQKTHLKITPLNHISKLDLKKLHHDSCEYPGCPGKTLLIGIAITLTKKGKKKVHRVYLSIEHGKVRIDDPYNKEIKKEDLLK
jgi:hypothetical protein